MVFGNVEIRLEAIHETADGRRLLVLHGDEFDGVIKASPLLEALGNRAYSFVLKLNRYVNLLRRAFGAPYWSLAAYLKHKVKNAVTYIANFERALAQETQRRGLDGAICGHIHRAEISQIDGVLYCNGGDWVESCTTLTEDFSGQLSLLRWTESKEVITHSGALAPCSLELRAAGVCATASVHDVVSHAVSGVRARTRADSASDQLRASAALPLGRSAHYGRGTDAAETAGNPRFS